MPMRMLASPAEPRHWLARVPMCYAECVVPWHAHWVTQGSVRRVRAFARASVKPVNGARVVCCPVRGLCRVQWIQLWLDLRYQEGSRGDATVLNLEASRLYTPHVVDTRRSLAPRCLYDHVSATSRSVIARRVRYRWPIHTYAFIYRGNPMLLDACQIRSNNCKRSLTRPRFRRRPPFGLRERRGAAAVVFGQRLARHELK